MWRISFKSHQPSHCTTRPYNSIFPFLAFVTLTSGYAAPSPFLPLTYLTLNQIQKDGYVAFNQGQLSYQFPVKFPVLPATGANMGRDPSLIAPFFAIQEIPGKINGAGVYFKVVELEKEQNITLRERIYADFREGMIGSANFRPKFALIITWRNMTFANKAPEFDMKVSSTVFKSKFNLLFDRWLL